MDRLDELAVFVAVLDSGSMAAAARRLHRSPPSISRILAGLEQRLGARLIDRTTRRLAPTEFGRHFAMQARDLIAQYEALTQAATHEADQPAGMLRITAPATFGRRHVAPMLADFLARFERVRATLVLSDRNLDLIEDGLDVAIRIGTLTDSTLVARKVGSVGRILVASPAYLEKRGTPRSVRGLANHDSILIESRPVAREWRFASGPHDREQHQVIRLTPRVLANDVEGAIAMARAGLGIVQVLSYQVTEELSAGHLVRLLPEAELPPTTVHLISTCTSHRPAKTTAFLDFAANALEQRLQVISRSSNPPAPAMSPPGNHEIETRQ
ncbi:LysR family transcriptional regulator [Gluconacetobacter aggeris]|uniref:LysR family transcriptional regulator n=1 Tax=Gluconacetobacter aggeris TaxID=1286186 RepID=A0A7W4NYB0_9PROT|nr:LysR family transcriptional regulator [Gluconacetobacter aggeris]MBB2167445.1 LysR family transcriptional regulator [Gluconacetobacter aggeris]